MVSAPLGQQRVAAKLAAGKKKWLVTGCAGFIGSNLLEHLLKNDQIVVGIDSLVTGHKRNLESVKKAVGEERYRNFHFIEDTIEKLDVCREGCKGVDFVLHQAALGSVPRSIENPINSHNANVNGFINMIFAAKEAGVKRFVYASSSSVYGTSEKLPKFEGEIGEPLSPYAATKFINEVYAKVFARVYDLNVIGLRYFNVFGKRQDPDGPYAAVIPKWVKALMKGEQISIFGDGETSRDFTFIDNVVQMNLLSAFSEPEACGTVYNVALGSRSTLNDLAQIISRMLTERGYPVDSSKIVHKDFRKGDVRHSLADISHAQKNLGYLPTHDMNAGLKECLDWYVKNL